MEPGLLYIVSGPIGNLGDITLRALEVLKSVNLILSEDTRETEKVLRQYNITRSQISYRDQNHAKIVKDVIETLQSGGSIALLSDSGTPTISDPGFKLVHDVKKAGVKVVSVPGPSAVISALSVSGLPTDKFTFLGFLPKSSGQREKLLKEYGESESTLVIYESPYRVIKLLEEIYMHLGDRTVCLASELTKIYEKSLTNRVSAFIDQNIKPKGEYVVLVAKEDFKYE